MHQCALRQSLQSGSTNNTRLRQKWKNERSVRRISFFWQLSRRLRVSGVGGSKSISKDRAPDEMPKSISEESGSRFLKASSGATKTPMGELIGSSPPGTQPLGASRRASTLRSRVRAVRRFLAWLALAHGVSFPTEVVHLTEHLQTRHSEPCNRGSLKVAHNAFVFLEANCSS